MNAAELDITLDVIYYVISDILILARLTQRQ